MEETDPSNGSVRLMNRENGMSIYGNSASEEFQMRISIKDTPRVAAILPPDKLNDNQRSSFGVLRPRSGKRR